MKRMIIFAATLLLSCNFFAQKGNELSFKTPADASAFFAYKPDAAIIISGHRGGQEPGFPENSIEGFQNVLRQMPAMFEIDPRLTKDSVIVLMHDATLDRTTTAKGKLSDYTWAELDKVRLKDHDGKVTNARIPRLEDVIVWSKGKTVINLDKKDVPLEKIVELILKHDAASHVMLTVHTGAQARYYYDRIPGVMMSAFARTNAEYEDMAISGVPWSQMIAYVGPTIDDKNRAIVEKLHAKGVRVMVSFAPTHDRLKTAAERLQAYKKEIALKPDIIESDIPTEVFKALK